ncbi:MAG: hypothetical protein HQL87_03445 [Magnetococcales bacterium]|nr:hypothetical protein [Magnetococcales bacterium]
MMSGRLNPELSSILLLVFVLLAGASILPIFSLRSAPVPLAPVQPGTVTHHRLHLPVFQYSVRDRSAKRIGWLQRETDRTTLELFSNQPLPAGQVVLLANSFRNLWALQPESARQGALQAGELFIHRLLTHMEQVVTSTTFRQEYWPAIRVCLHHSVETTLTDPAMEPVTQAALGRLSQQMKEQIAETYAKALSSVLQQKLEALGTALIYSFLSGERSTLRMNHVLEEAAQRPEVVRAIRNTLDSFMETQESEQFMTLFVQKMAQHLGENQELLQLAEKIMADPRLAAPFADIQQDLVATVTRLGSLLLLDDHTASLKGIPVVMLNRWFKNEANFALVLDAQDAAAITPHFADDTEVLALP